MDFKQIQELIKLVNESNIGEVSIEQKDLKLTIRRKEEHVIQSVGSVQQMPVQTTTPQHTLQQSLPSAPAASAGKTPDATAEIPSNTTTIKSPMIGTFYRKPSPDKPNLVEIGDEVSPGKVVCIIEAMKLFNEIESEVKGKVVKVLVEDASPVEYDQPLFLVEPS
jgi:acetyl-CoA carboxylase biotin carboxyl carrier protein